MILLKPQRHFCTKSAEYNGVIKINLIIKLDFIWEKKCEALT